MTKRYINLQKKLQELEAEIGVILALPAETTPNFQELSESIEKRFQFLKNLISAEHASRQSNPRLLRHIAERLTELEFVFCDWKDYRIPSKDHLDPEVVCIFNESGNGEITDQFAHRGSVSRQGDEEVQQNLPSEFEQVQEGKKKIETAAEVQDEENVESSGDAQVQEGANVQEGKEKAGTVVAEEDEEKRRISIMERYYLSGLWIGRILFCMLLIGGLIRCYSPSSGLIQHGRFPPPT